MNSGHDHFLLKPVVAFLKVCVGWEKGKCSLSLNSNLSMIFKVTLTLFRSNLVWSLFASAECCIRETVSRGKLPYLSKTLVSWNVCVGSLKDVTNKGRVLGSTLRHACSPKLLIFVGHDPPTVNDCLFPTKLFLGANANCLRSQEHNGLWIQYCVGSKWGFLPAQGYTSLWITDGQLRTWSHTDDATKTW